MPQKSSITVASVLLIPAKGDPHGLLREGVCGSRPPMAWRFDTEHCEECGLPLVDGDCPSPPGSRTAGSEGRLGCWEGRGNDNDGVWHPEWMGEEDREVGALALAWEGEPVPEGLDRAYRAAGDRPERYHRMSEMPDAGRWFGSVGTVVFLDADGRVVTS